MKRPIAPLIFLAVLVFALLCPVYAAPPEPNAEASLTLYYQKDGQAFPDLPIAIYRVAEMLPDGTLELVEPFTSYPVNIYGITTQEQWNLVAQTLYSYITADAVAPDREALTDTHGTVCFAGLQTGLYFVREAVAEYDSGSYIFNQFMMILPTPQPDGTYNYNVEARPKCTSFLPKTQYTVTKLWQDGGNQHARPKEVTIDIYKDGILKQTQILDASNNWTYTWYVTGEDQEKWTVIEREIPEEYKVTIEQNGSTFSIINTRQSQQVIPDTGDSFALMTWFLVMCFSGMMLMLLGIYSWRRK